MIGPHPTKGRAIGAAPGDDRWKTEAAAHQQARQRLSADAADPRCAHGSPGSCQERSTAQPVVKALLARAHRNVVTVALANKLARIAWTVLARDRRYVAVQTAAS